MKAAEIQVTGSEVAVTRYAALTAGMVGASVVFTAFSPDWEGLSKTAVFRTGREIRDVTGILPGEPVIIPWEVLEAPSPELMAGVCGVGQDGALVIPTVWGSLGSVCPGARPADRPGTPPTPDWTRQMETRVAQALEQASAAGSAADQAEASAREALQNARRAGTGAESAVEAADRAGGDAATALAAAISAREDRNLAQEAAALAAGHGIMGAEAGDLMQIASVKDGGIPDGLRPVSRDELEGRFQLVQTLEADGSRSSASAVFPEARAVLIRGRIVQGGPNQSYYAAAAFQGTEGRQLELTSTQVRHGEQRYLWSWWELDRGLVRTLWCESEYSREGPVKGTAGGFPAGGFFTEATVSAASPIPRGSSFEIWTVRA